MFRIIFLPIIFLFLLVSSTLSFASNRIGVVGAINSSVTAKNINGISRQLKLGDHIYYNDTISANDNGNAQLLFIDKSSLTIGSNSAVRIDNFIYNPSSSNGTFVMRGVKGTFRFVGGALSKENAVEFKTPVGIIGIRGSITIININHSTGATDAMFVYGKQLTFTNLAGIMQTINQHGLTINVNTPSAAPQAISYSPTAINSLVKALSGRPGTSAGAEKIPTSNDISTGLKTDSNKNIEPPSPTVNNDKENDDSQLVESDGKRTLKVDPKGNLIKTYTDTSGNYYTTTTTTSGSSTESFVGIDGWTYNGSTDIDGTSNGTTISTDGTKYSFDNLQEMINELNNIVAQNQTVIDETVTQDDPTSPPSRPLFDHTNFGCSDCNYIYWGTWANVLNNFNDSGAIDNLNLLPYRDNAILENVQIPQTGSADYSGNVYGSILNSGVLTNYSGNLTATIILDGEHSYINPGALGIYNFGSYNMHNANPINFGADGSFAIFKNQQLMVNGSNIGHISGALFNNEAQNLGGNFSFNAGNEVSANGIYIGNKTP